MKPRTKTENPLLAVGRWPKQLRAKDHRMEWIASLGPFLIPIVAVIVGGAIAITAIVLKHQERIAKIERGIDPDAPQRGVSPKSASSDLECAGCGGVVGLI